MEGAINLILSISQTKSEYLPSLVNAIDEHQVFTSLTSTHVDTIISTLNTLLNAHKTRFTGLTLLKAFVAQCALETLDDKGGLWVILCTRTCNQKTLTNEISVAYEIIDKIIRRSTQTPQLSKLITSSLLGKIIESCLGHGGAIQLQIMSLLELCLQTYPGPTGMQRSTIQKIIAANVDATNTVAVNRAAKCQLLLQQARGGGVQGISVKDAWSLYQRQLIGSIHECFNLMFTNTVETCDGDTSVERLSIPPLNLSDEPITKANQLATRCGNLITYLEIALRDPFPVVKAVQPTTILNLINRGLDVNCLTIAKNLVSDNIAIGIMLPGIHVKLFKLLDSLIQILGSNLLIHCRQICKLLIQSLKWSDSGESFGGKRPYLSVRVAAYDTLIKWCQMSKSGSTIESFIEQLLKFILKDSTPFENEIMLQVLPGSKKYMSKKARKRLHSAHNEQSNIAQKHSNVQKTNKNINYDDGNETLCAKALECLSEVLKAAGCFIKPNIHKILQDHIVFLAIEISTSSQTKKNLYTHWSCRRYLYECLKNLVFCAHHLAPPPFQYAVEILSNAQFRDCNAIVRNQCTSYMHDFEKIIHPNKDCLYFPIDKNELENIKYAQNNRPNSKNTMAAENSGDDEDGDMRLILSQSSTGSELINSKTVVINGEQTPIEKETEIVANDECENIVVDKHADQLEEHEPNSNKKDLENSTDSLALEDTGKTDLTDVAVSSKIDDVDALLETSANQKKANEPCEIETIVIEQCDSEKEEKLETKSPAPLDSVETIDIDSDDVIHEITDDDEPEKKKQKIPSANISTTSEIIDCEAMESCFVDEVNENIIDD